MISTFEKLIVVVFAIATAYAVSLSTPDYNSASQDYENVAIAE